MVDSERWCQTSERDVQKFCWLDVRLKRPTVFFFFLPPPVWFIIIFIYFFYQQSSRQQPPSPAHTLTCKTALEMFSTLEPLAPLKLHTHGAQNKKRGSAAWRHSLRLRPSSPPQITENVTKKKQKTNVSALANASRQEKLQLFFLK